MRKLLLNLTVAITITSSVVPVTACTFNFYVDRSKDKIKHLLASQTSNIIKSLVLSNQINSETKQTIDDIFSREPQNNIANQSSGGTTISNWGDFNKYWGKDGNIKVNGFDQDKFIVAKGDNTLTNKVNNNNSTDSTLDSVFSYAHDLNIINNSLVYNNVISPSASVNPTIIKYLKMLQNPKTLPPSIAKYWPLISNLINNFQGSFLTPISNLLNDLVDGWKNVPTKIQDLESYMEQWKDNGQPYSQWVDNKGKWTLADMNSETAKWKTNDYVLYRGGTMLNYLFKKIGTDTGGKVPSQYLGEIISKNIDDPLSALTPYINLLTTNPAYILMIINGALPVIKQTILQMNDISQGVNHLTIGKGYPTNKNINSWNALDILNTIKTLTNNPDSIKKVVDNLLSSPFLYDVKIDYQGFQLPLPKALIFKPDAKTQLITTLTNLLTGDTFKNIFNSIYDLVNKLNDQFPIGGIDLNLVNLKSLLIGDHGLFNQLNTVLQTLSKIIKPDQDITDNDLNTLYTELGGIIPDKGVAPVENFQPNSILDIIKSQFSQKNSSLENLLTLIYNSDGTHKGLVQLLIEKNKQWNDDNYYNYFDIDNKNSTFSNINFKESTSDKIDIIDLDYQFTFKIKDKTFTFFISGQSQDNITTFAGTHNFKFKEIDLIS